MAKDPKPENGRATGGASRGGSRVPGKGSGGRGRTRPPTSVVTQQKPWGLIAAAVVCLLACAREIELKVDSKENSPRNSQAATPEYNDNVHMPPEIDEGSKFQGPIVPVLTPTPADWQSGPEELVVAYTGGIIQNYPNFKESCQQYIDRLTPQVELTPAEWDEGYACFDTADYREGIAAFIAKRKPTFQAH